MATKKIAEDAYLAAHQEATALVDRIRRLLGDLPAPEMDGQPIHWGHVGTINEVNTRLAAVVAFLDGSEK